MRETLELPTKTVNDLACLLERASALCDAWLPDEIVSCYREQVEGVAEACGMEKTGAPAGFGHNAAEDLGNLIDLQARAATEGASSSEYVGRPEAIMLKLFRDYLVYAVSQLPIGTSVYWRPEAKGHLRLVVTDGKRPKGHLKLI